MVHEEYSNNIPLQKWFAVILELQPDGKERNERRDGDKHRCNVSLWLQQPGCSGAPETTMTASPRREPEPVAGGGCSSAMAVLVCC
jgi:hypothetical protein